MSSHADLTHSPNVEPSLEISLEQGKRSIAFLEAALATMSDGQRAIDRALELRDRRWSADR
jgi:hypothetical protein